MGGARFLLVYSSKFELVAFFSGHRHFVTNPAAPFISTTSVDNWTKRSNITRTIRFLLYLYNYVYTNATPSSVQRMYSLVQKPVTAMAHHHCGTAAGSFTRETGFGHRARWLPCAQQQQQLFVEGGLEGGLRTTDGAPVFVCSIVELRKTKKRACRLVVAKGRGAE